MKEQLRRCYTEYDDKAKHNQRGVFKIQQVRQQKAIKEVENIDNFNQQYFTLRELDSQFASTPAVANHPKFKEIQKLFAAYNQQIHPHVGQADAKFHSKKEIMDATKSMFILMVLSPSVQTKITILELTHQWVLKQLNPQTLRPPKRDLVQELKDFCNSVGVIEIPEWQKKLPNLMSKNEKIDYSSKARTHHTDLDAPSFELERHLTRKINVQNTEKKSQSLDLVALKKKRKERAVYKKSQILDFIPEKQENQSLAFLEQSNTDRNINVKEIQTLSFNTEEPQTIRMNNDPIIQAQILIEEKEGNQIIEGPISNSQALQSIPYEQKYEYQFQNEVSEEEDKKGKLDPNTKAYIYPEPHHNDVQDVHPSASLKGQSIHNKIGIQSREDAQFLKRISQWAGTRSQFKTELSRKIESSRTFFGQPQRKANNGEIKDQMQKMRVNRTIQEGKRFIQGLQSEDEKVVAEPGLSVFSKRDKVSSVKSTRTFESILKEHRRHNTSEDLMEEVEDLKKKLASKRVYTSMAVLQKSMLPPEEAEVSFRQKTQRPLSLLSNPMLKKKKKKKVLKKRRW